MVLCFMYVSGIVRLDFILVGSWGFDFLWLDMTEWGSWDLDLLLHGLVVGKIIEDFELFFKVVGASSSIEYGFFFDLMGFFFSSAGGAGGLSKSGVGADAGDLCLVGVAADGEVVGVCFLKWVGFNFVWLNLYEAEQVGAFALKLMKSGLSGKTKENPTKPLLEFLQGVDVQSCLPGFHFHSTFIRMFFIISNYNLLVSRRHYVPTCQLSTQTRSNFSPSLNSNPIADHKTHIMTSPSYYSTLLSWQSQANNTNINQTWLLFAVSAVAVVFWYAWL
ncbi:unnamed protein product [Prunus armeniaca]|uniref:Uncharacterized protein n=1 Tax=Prunus armeniaca TaxID=36596 RepID=A0A6J5X8H7_PRUAR|nr:unnamed protein product [Prunus armeniaca]